MAATAGTIASEGYVQDNASIQAVAANPVEAPRLTGAQIALLAPTIVLRRGLRVDESPLRRKDPTLWDLGKLTPLERWKRTHTEDLREPLPGSGLVVAGEVSMPWMRYVRAAARNQVPGTVRVRRCHELLEHTIAPCENHIMVPWGEESMSYKDILRFFTGRRHKFIPHASHIHEVNVRLVEGDADGKYLWTCRRCGQSSFEHYTVETLGRATGVVWHRCVKCSSPNFVPSLSRRQFLRLGAFGAAAYAGFDAWVRSYSAWRAYPRVPSAYGAAHTFFVDHANGSDSSGTGGAGAPWKTYEKARRNMTVNNGDTVKGRGSHAPDEAYVEVFDARHMFPAGSSFSNATTVTNDTGHTPTFRPNAPVSCITNYGAAQQYVVFRGVSFDCVAMNGAGIRGSASSESAATAAHHLRISGCEFFNLNADTGYLSLAMSHHCEVLSSHFRTTRGPGAGAGVHAIYFQGADNLAQANEAHSWGNKGYGVHAYDGRRGGDGQASRCVYRRNMFHLVRGAGIRIGEGQDQLCYTNLVYDNAAVPGGIHIPRDSSTAKILNNTVVANATGGISIAARAVGTYLRNNISDLNDGTGNFSDRGIGTDHASGSTNSWNNVPVPGWASEFASYATRDLHIGAKSSAIGRATPIVSHVNTGTFPEASIVDYDGVVVPRGKMPDSGAYQYVYR